MQNFIESAIEYIDIYQLREIAHTCAPMRDMMRARQRTVVLRNDSIKLTPVDSMLARSSLTMTPFNRDGRSYPTVARWIDEIWHNVRPCDNRARLLTRAICRYDDVEFARVLFAYIGNDVTNKKYAHMWRRTIHMSIPSSPEVRRVSDLLANCTQSARIFTFLCSRENTKRVTFAPDQIDSVLAYLLEMTICANNLTIARALLTLRNNVTTDVRILIQNESIGYDMYHLCTAHGISVSLRDCTLLDRIVSPGNRFDIDGIMLSSVFDAIAMDIRDPTVIRAILNQHDVFRALEYRDIISVCCHANRQDVADIVIEQMPSDIILVPLCNVIEFQPRQLASMRDMALMHIVDHPKLTIYAALNILYYASTPDQVRALMSSDAITAFARVISDTSAIDDTSMHTTPLVVNIGLMPTIEPFRRIKSARMYDLWREFGFEIEYWPDVIHAIICSRNVDEIKHMVEHFNDMRTDDVWECMDVMISLIPHQGYIYPRAHHLDQASIRYLVSRITKEEDDYSNARCMFMLGMILDDIELMRESRYMLCINDINETFAQTYRYLYSHSTIKEFFDPSCKVQCYRKLIPLCGSTRARALIRELSEPELAEIIP